MNEAQAMINEHYEQIYSNQFPLEKKLITKDVVQLYFFAVLFLS